MNISLAQDVKAFVDEQVRANGYGSSSEDIRDLIHRHKDIADFPATIQDAIASGEAESPTKSPLHRCVDARTPPGEITAVRRDLLPAF